MESWRKVWRDGFVPSLSTAGLLALRKALAEDDPRLTQGSTTTPPPLQCVADWPVEGGDAIVVAHWLGDRGGEATVGEVEEFFAMCLMAADERMGEPAACRYFLNFWDNTSRDEALRELGTEIELELRSRSEPQITAETKELTRVGGR